MGEVIVISIEDGEGVLCIVFGPSLRPPSCPWGVVLGAKVRLMVFSALTVAQLSVDYVRAHALLQCCQLLLLLRLLQSSPTHHIRCICRMHVQIPLTSSYR